MSDTMARLNCSIASPAGSTVTVGDLLTLTCQGPIEHPLKSPVHFVFSDPNLKHSLKVARVMSSDQNALVLEVYSHKAGELREQNLVVTDGTSSYQVDGLKLQVSSVLKQGDKMNPPFGPVSLSYPLWFWLVLAVLVLALALVFLGFHRRSRERRQLILDVLGEGRERIPFKELVKVQNAQAYNQFSRDLRAIQKKLAWGDMDTKSVWADLEKSFKFYLARELLAPAFAWSPRKILKDIRKHHPQVYEESKRDLRRILQEFEKGEGQKITVNDCEQVYQLSRSVGEAIYQSRRRGKRP